MPEKEKGVRKFGIKHDRAWSWHIGFCLCTEPKSRTTGKRDIYLLICLGTHDFSIGMMTWYDESEGRENG